MSNFNLEAKQAHEFQPMTDLEYRLFTERKLLNADNERLRRDLEIEIEVNGVLRSRLAEAERNEGTLLGMIHHQRDALRECLPYLNESMAGKRPGRSADDIRAAVKALTSASADGPKGEK